VINLKEAALPWCKNTHSPPESQWFSHLVVQKLYREASYWVELAQKYAVLEELA